MAIIWAAFWNFIGALAGTAVATTIGKGLVDTHAVTMVAVLSALLGAILWNLLTWWMGLPSVSSTLHRRFVWRGPCERGGDWTVLKWSTGLWPKVVLPMLFSPLLGFVGGAILMMLLTVGLRRATPGS